MYSKSKVANPVVVSWTGKINIIVPVRAWKFGLARRVRQSRPAPACSFPYSGWIWCLLAGFLRSSAAASCFFLNHHTPSGQSRVYRVTQLRADGVHCRESAGIGPPVVLKVVPVTGAALAGHHGPIDMRLSFPHLLSAWSGHVEAPYVLCRYGHMHHLLLTQINNTWTTTQTIMDIFSHQISPS